MPQNKNFSIKWRYIFEKELSANMCGGRKS